MDKHKSLRTPIWNSISLGVQMTAVIHLDNVIHVLSLSFAVTFATMRCCHGRVPSQRSRKQVPVCSWELNLADGQRTPYFYRNKNNQCSLILAVISSNQFIRCEITTPWQFYLMFVSVYSGCVGVNSGPHTGMASTLYRLNHPPPAWLQISKAKHNKIEKIECLHVIRTNCIW